MGVAPNVKPGQVKDLLEQGYRIVDLEVRSASRRLASPMSRTPVTTRRAWWWYYGKTGAQVKASSRPTRPA